MKPNENLESYFLSFCYGRLRCKRGQAPCRWDNVSLFNNDEDQWEGENGCDTVLKPWNLALPQ